MLQPGDIDAVTDQLPPPALTSKLPILIGAAIAAITVIVAAIVIAVVMSNRPAEPAAANVTPSSVLSVETQVECTGIRREYLAWNRDMPRLSTMVTASNPRDVVRHELDALKESGDALLKAVTGYDDQPAKQLAVAVATYNVDLGFVSLEHQLTNGQISADKKDKAVASAGTVQTAYKTFMQNTCGENS